MHMRIEDVRVVDRYRKDLGDIEALAKSIASVTMLNPITVTSDGQLIAGHRRLEACRLLGRETIEALVADDLETAADRLTAERDENVERKPMTPEELVSLGMALEELERPRARERMMAGQAPSGHVTGGSETREIVGKALGMSATTYERAKSVVKAAQSEDLSPVEQELAQDALADMNATRNISGNYEKIREAGLLSFQRKAKANGRAIRQRPVLADARKQRHAISSAAASLSGIALGLNRIEELHPDITSEEAALWVGDLSEARLSIERLIRRLKERINA